MAQATNTTLGTITLSADLAGGASSPQLAPTGVAPGSYTNVSKMHIDSKGRVVWCGKANYDKDIIPNIANASSTTEGICYVGKNINYAAGGLISVNIATAGSAGLIKVGNNLAINQSTGALDIVVPDASSTTFGSVQIGSGFSATNGLLYRTSWQDTSKTVKGMPAQIGSGFSISSGVLSVNEASTTVKGVAAIDTSNFYLDTANMVLYPHAANYMLYGVVQGWSNDFSLVNGKLTYTSPYASTIASSTVLGNVKVGSGLYVAGDGTLSLFENDTSTSVKGIVQADVGFSVSAGILSANLATALSAGLVKPGTTFNITGSLIDVKNASATQKGVVQISEGFDIAGGVLSSANATTTSKGVVQVGSNLNIASGVLSIPNATASTLGAVSIDTTYLGVTGGTVSCTAQATTLAKGLVQVGGGLSVATGTMRIQDATATQKGIVQVGSGFTVTTGTISANTATAATAGIFSFDSNYFANDTIGADGTAEAGTSGFRFNRAWADITHGVVKSNNASNITIAAGGLIDVGTNVPLKNTYNYYSKAQQSSKTTWSYFSSDWGTYSNVFEADLSANGTVSAPTGYSVGQVKTYIVKQDATGGRTLTWNSVYKFPGGTPPTLSTAPNAVDILTIICKSSTEFLVLSSTGY